MVDIVEQVLKGEIRAVARLIRDIDDRVDGFQEHLKKIFPRTGQAYVVGITGSPGVGKSTLTDQLVRHLRSLGKTVGVLAVDPTSPFSGGAILGDRIRMQRHSTDSGVFIRSMATRGEFGGLTRSTRGAIMVLDAMGKDVIIVETVGVGQDEVDIARTADTTVIVVAPGLGDDIQALKAGILEVGDVFVVNKADREGADKTVRELQGMFELEHAASSINKDWTPPVIKAVAIRNEGVGQVWEEMEKHQGFLAQGSSDYYRRLDRLKAKMELVDLVKQSVVDSVLKKLEGTGRLDKYVEDLLGHKSDPYTITEHILQDILT